jgi:multidrug efflux system membrane fusion protein
VNDSPDHAGEIALKGQTMPESGPNANNPLNTKEPAAASETTTFPPHSPQPERSGPSSQGHELQPKKRHWWVWIILILLILGGIYFYRQHEASAQATKSAANQAPRSIPVTTAVATKGDMGDYVAALATVVPVYTVTITGRVQGEIIALHYNEGQLVKKGDPLIDIDPRPYQAQLTQMEGQLAHDQAVLDEARIDLTRYQAAFSRNAIAKQQVDDQTQVVLQDEGTVKNDQGQLDAVKVNIVYCHIISPIDGRVGLRLVDLGNIVQANSSTPLVVITQLQPITAIFSVSQKFLPQIETQLRQGQKMGVDVTDTEDKKLASGYVLTTDNQVDNTTSTIRLKAIFQNSDFALFPQQFVNVRLQLDTEHDVTLVPTAAVQMNSQGSYVYIVNADQTASTRTVKAGTAGGGNTVVQGVNPGDVVATNGFNNLQDGAKVRVQNGNGGGSGGPSSAAGTSPQNSNSAKSGKKKGSGSGASNSNGGNH